MDVQVYRKSLLKQSQYRFAVNFNFGTLSTNDCVVSIISQCFKDKLGPTLFYTVDNANFTWLSYLSGAFFARGMNLCLFAVFNEGCTKCIIL